MFAEKIINRAVGEDSQLKTDRSRCLRMRLDGNRCSACIDICPVSAISIDDDVRIDEGLCTGCMLCSSVCRSDSFEMVGLDFYSLLGRLRKIESSVSSPVLGCVSRTNPCHAKASCFGLMAEEHIIAFSVFLDNTLQIDMTGCAACRNRAVINIVRQRIADAEVKTSFKISDKVRLVMHRENLEYHPVSYDRRGFFRALKTMTCIHAAGLLDGESGGAAIAYSSKKVPFKRELMNRTLKAVPELKLGALLNNYCYLVSASGECDECSACVGICPSGALIIDRKEDDRTLMFKSSFCSGCGLCEFFCMKGALSVYRGYSGKDPFSFGRAKKDELCTA